MLQPKLKTHERWYELQYHVDDLENDEYYLYLEEPSLERLPTQLAESLDGIGISIPTIIDFITIKATRRKDIGELFCERIYERLVEHWDYDLGLPYIKFTGSINGLDDLFKQRPVVLYLDQQQTTAYMDAMPFLTRFTFLAQPDTHHFKVISQDHVFLVHWLEVAHTLQLQQARNDTKFDINKIHANWYPDAALREELLARANNAISEFVVRKGLDIYIPEFMVVPVFHIRRYQKAQHILRAKFDPYFIMTLPITLDRSTYTILFPISRPITRRNLHTSK